jgi:hypothetical protein
MKGSGSSDELRRACVFVLLALLGGARSAHADWLITPFAGATIRTDTSLLDLDGVAGRPHATYGVALTLFPERVFGADIETSWTPSAFTGHDLVESSRVLSATGSVVLALPKRWSRVVRPYATIGTALIHITSTDIAGIFPIESTRLVGSAGAGIWLPMTARLGARGDVRFMRSGSEPAPSRFETWQTTLGATVRF